MTFDLLFLSRQNLSMYRRKIKRQLYIEKQGHIQGGAKGARDPYLNILMAENGKILGRNRGKSLKKREKRDFEHALKHCTRYAPAKYFKDQL